MRSIEAVAAGLVLLGEMYFGVGVLEYETTPWQNSWSSLVVTALLIVVGPHLMPLSLETGLHEREGNS